MKRIGYLTILALTLALAGGSAASLAAQTPPTGLEGKGPPSASRREARPGKRVERIAPRVSVGGVRLGYLRPFDAERKLRSRFDRPVVIVAGGTWLRSSRARLGAVPDIRTALLRARRAPAGRALRLPIGVRTLQAARVVERLARKLDRAPVNSTRWLRGTSPVISPARAGRALDQTAAVRQIVGALRAGAAGPVRLRLHRVNPSVTPGSFGSLIVIKRESKQLLLYQGSRFEGIFGVATGQSSYPTPLGAFSIVVKHYNPWWYPPSSDWAEGLEPVPPGPGNPLGTRWMGISAPGVGIHGTPDPASIGYSASHGCVRMHIAEAEALFERVSVGTPVYILAV